MLQNSDYISYSKLADQEKHSISFDIPLAIEHVKTLKRDETMETYFEDYRRYYPMKAGFVHQFIQKYQTEKYPFGVYRFIHSDNDEAKRLMKEYHLSDGRCVVLFGLINPCYHE